MYKISKNIFNWDNMSIIEKINIITSVNNKKCEIQNKVFKILKDVEKHGDVALKKYTLKFDKIKLNDFFVSRKRLKKSSLLVKNDFKKAILMSFNNIQKFHKLQKIKDIDVNISSGIRCQRITTPIDSIGLYIPGGITPLISTVLMLSIPAKIAGCSNIVLCSPPPIKNEMLYAAKICGIKKILQLGGAQAIAALAFGTNTIHKVNKIFGPGNAFVTEAKIQARELVSGLSIDMPAGPSEVLIIADEFSNPEFIAADLLAQAEHDYNSQVMLLTSHKNLAYDVLFYLNKQIKNLSRKEYIISSWKNSKIIVTSSLEESFNISNQYAPEHLILHLQNARKYLSQIKNAGSIFIGSWTPESAGDYITGTNHVLPTYGYAKTYSGLSVLDFQKLITVQEISKISLKDLANNISILSKAEGLDAHDYAVSVRMNSWKFK
ncbi:histidinol dehydrogenase [Buchnera aphidicola (Cinara tujafilina)]|uniref:Histidinol dehydrogenase n=1 Tax=Buchnera aphidicola (Cinara tujafilina) TaxID=261317 RepID=F7WZ07_9GAMM|nr:histidinol dehydrogenase [Buchnera aphidicola]AEH39657.1 histidinol dehydrogenase [Buchnera aphidicola (Cinara tujafilina)]